MPRLISIPDAKNLMKKQESPWLPVSEVTFFLQAISFLSITVHKCWHVHEDNAENNLQCTTEIRKHVKINLK